MSADDDMSVDARRVAELAGGTWAAPTQEYHETADREYNIETPLVLPNSPTVRIPRPEDLYPWRNYADITQIDPQATIRTVEFERREWQSRVWVPDRPEEYDAATNTLHYYGHWRIHRFHVWVPYGAPYPTSDH